jgi:hypothetical protein
MRTAAQKKPPYKKEGMTKKTTFSDREYVAQPPNVGDVAALKDKEGYVLGLYLPIEVVERDLDRWPWRTENFAYQQYRSLDKYGSPCLSASLELVIPWKDDSGKITERRLVGCCNFAISNYTPNLHFVATAKSECVKNAASDLGKRFGRGLNEEIAAVTGEVPAAVEKPKKKPDKTILETIRKFKEAGDESAIAIYANIYDLNTQENETDESLHQ